MKAPSTVLALLLLAAAPVFAAGGGETTVMADGTEETVPGPNGTRLPKYVSGFDVPYPGQVVRGNDPGPSAFNALETLGKPPMETITVTGADGKTYNHQAWFERDEKGRITGGKISFDTGNSCAIPVPLAGLAANKNPQPYEAAFLADVAKKKEDYAAMPDLLAAAGVTADRQNVENKGFCPSGNCTGPGEKAGDKDSKTPPSTDTGDAPPDTRTPPEEVAGMFNDSGLFASIGGNDMGDTAGGFDSKTSPGGKVRAAAFSWDKGSGAGLTTLIDGEERVKALLGDELPALTNTPVDNLQNARAPTTITVNQP